MTEGNSTRPPVEAFYEVRDPEQARLLTDPVSKEFFKPFLARERTVSQVAAELGCSVSTILYRVNTFLKVGLLFVTRDEKRAGRAIKHYRSVRDAFFIPFDRTPYAGLEERLIAQLEPFWRGMIARLARAYRDNGLDGQSMYRGEDGTIWTNFAADAFETSALATFASPVVLYRDATVQLTDEEVRALQRTLNDLFERSLEGQRRRGKAYTLQVALVPYERPD